MLQNLYVKNLALIDECEVEFSDGLNILSGETGAGKSIIIGSINLALGEKVQKEMLRDNEKPAFVELIFSVEDPKIRINNKYTKKEFADILGLKSDKQVDRWEKGVSIPSVKSIINICNFLSIRPDDVLVFSVFNGKMHFVPIVI